MKNYSFILPFAFIAFCSVQISIYYDSIENFKLALIWLGVSFFTGIFAWAGFFKRMESKK
jgi:hypothetical protein